MALIKCPECQKTISSRAKVCPNCGYNVKSEFKKIEQEEKLRQAQEQWNSTSKSTKTITIVVIAIIAIIVLVFVVKGFTGTNLRNKNHHDGKCDICGKTATYSGNNEEYCDTHLKDAVDWYIE